MKKFPFGLLLVLVINLSACKVELTNMDEDKDEFSEIIIEETGHYGPVNPDVDEYDLIITGANNHLEVRGNVRKLLISNNGNQIEMIEKDHLELLSISASFSIIDATDVKVMEIKLTGNNNIITLTSCDSLLITGVGNQVVTMDKGQCEQSLVQQD